MDYLERGTSTVDNWHDEPLLNPLPRLRGFLPLVAVAFLLALPLAFVAGFIATTRPHDGLFALPLLTGCIGLLLRENLG